MITSAENARAKRHKRTHLRSALAAGAIAVGALILTATPAEAADPGSTPKDICNEMGGQYNAEINASGSVLETCTVATSGGSVTGTWIDGTWNGTVGDRSTPTVSSKIPPVPMQPAKPASGTP